MMLLNETADGFRLNRYGIKKRIPMVIHFKAVGMDGAGAAFVDDVYTVNVSAGGGCLRLRRELKRGEVLTLLSPKGASFTVHVCWLKHDTRRNARYMGFKLVEPVGQWVISHGEQVLPKLERAFNS
ncbi:MAG: PilZ domain-containing protein [Terriglobia bacterium]